MRKLYQAGLRSGFLRADPRQQIAVESLAKLQSRLTRYEPKLIQFRCERDALVAQQRQLLEGQNSSNPEATAQHEDDGDAMKKSKEIEDLLAQLGPPPRKPRGLFIHGEVGTGKTFMMDMFFESLDVERKRRVHLHDFMMEVHQRIHRWKHSERDRLAAIKDAKEASLGDPLKPDSPSNMSSSSNISLGGQKNKDEGRIKVAESDGISEVAKMISDECSVLALDEFVVTDVVDALILKHLFGVMFDRGTVLVATSNTAPEDLYHDGLNYFYFQPFIPLLTSQCKVFDMAADIDYRQLRLRGEDDVSGKRYLSPVNPETRASFDATFEALAGDEPQGARTVPVAFGRSISVERCAGSRVCRVSFKELCGDFEPVMAAPDYQALCDTFQAVMIEDVPCLGLANHNELRRFIILIDQFYDRGVDVVILAEKPLEELYDGGMQLSEKDEGVLDDLFALSEMKVAKKRMLSRLVEMTC